MGVIKIVTEFILKDFSGIMTTIFEILWNLLVELELYKRLVTILKFRISRAQLR